MTPEQARRERAEALVAHVTVGIVTALPKELAAAKAMLDGPVEHSVGGKGAGRSYVMGEIPARGGGTHAVALVRTGMGNNLAATRVTQMLEHLPGIDAVVMVGIAGGVPHPEKPSEHVRLGDIVVLDRRGVIQYDFDKETVRGKESRHSPRPPSARLLEGVEDLEVAAFEGETPWVDLIARGARLEGAERPAAEADRLADSRDPAKVIDHPAGPRRAPGLPRVFHGPIASGNTLLKNPIARDRLRDLFGVKAVEMEGSGLADAVWQHEIGYLVVRGICDYCDEHKGDDWQMHAAIIAAAYARAVLERVHASEPPFAAEDEPRGELREADRRGGPGGSRPDRRWTDGPRDDLLERVLKVCELRERRPGRTVEIVRKVAPAPFHEHAEVYFADSTGARTYALAAVSEPIRGELLESFRDQVHARYRATDPGVLSTLVHVGEPAPEDLRREARAAGVHLTNFVEYQGFIDFSAYVVRQTARLEADRLYPPRLFIPQRLTYTFGREERSTDDALQTVARWLDTDQAQFILILGDFGVGKTFLLHELARRMGHARGPVTPMLIEMRSLEKARSLNALISQHLFVADMEQISASSFRYMLSEGRIALLFDGFDELALRVSYDRAAEHFGTLIEAAIGKAKVVLTSRTQHFRSDQQVKTELGVLAETLPGYRLAKLQPFSPAQVRSFLVNRLGTEEEADARVKLLDEVKDLLGLSQNPRMLAFIADLPAPELLEAQDKTGTITAAGLYRRLLERWIKNEQKRVDLKVSAAGLTEEDRWQAVTALAVRLWSKIEPSVHVSELPGAVAGAIQSLTARQLDDAAKAFEVGSGTLLVRDPEGNFSFLHQSVMEWLVANVAADEIRRGAAATALSACEMSDQMTDFFAALAGRDAAVAWARRTLEDGGAGEVAVHNALRVLRWLDVEARPGLRLAGRDLRGQDLSGRDLRGADLTGADLTGARLMGADLRGASLRRARLVRADLSRARAARASFAGADLSFARLLETDLRGAVLEGARLRVTALIGAKLDEGALDGLDAFGAALAPPPRVEAAMYEIVTIVTVANAVAFSPDGAFVISGHDFGSVLLWDTVSGKVLRILKGHMASVRCVAFSPNGEIFASASLDRTVIIWDAVSGLALRILKAHTASIRSIAFSPDGKVLASASSDKTIILWDTSSGTMQRVLRGHLDTVWSVVFSPNGKTLASASYDRTVILWDVASSTALRVLRGHSDSVWSIAFSPDGKTLASASSDRSITLWETASGTVLRVLSDNLGIVLGVAFSPDGEIVASTCSNSRLTLWDTATGTVQRFVELIYGSSWSIAFSPEGRTLASSGQAVTFWDAATGNILRVLKIHAREIEWHSATPSIAFSPDGETLAATLNTFTLWNVAMGNELCHLKDPPEIVSSVAFSPDGKILAADNGKISLLDAVTRNVLRVIEGHSVFAFSPDNRILASVSSRDKVTLWDVATCDALRDLDGDLNSVSSIAFSPDGEILAIASCQREISLWEVASGTLRRVVKGHDGSVLYVAFSPDGMTLATASMDETVILRGAIMGNIMRVLKGHSGGVFSVAFSPDGKILAAASGDGTVTLWDAASGDALHILLDHSAPIANFAFSPDGKSLATVSDGGIRLWSPVTGTCLAVLLPSANGWAAFTPDGRFKLGGDIRGAFWHMVGLCRFEPGELDPYLPAPLRVPDDQPLFTLPAAAP